jgi:hypothetical protein
MITKAQRGTKWSQSLIHEGAQRVTKGTKDHTVPQSCTKPYPTIPFPNHTLYSREDLRLLLTASLAILIVVHIAEVSTLYPHIVISSTSVTREPLLCHSLHFLWCMNQRSLHAVTKVYYRSISCFATVSWQTVPAYSTKVSHIKHPLLHHVVQAVHKVCHRDWSQSMVPSPLNRAWHITYSIPN